MLLILDAAAGARFDRAVADLLASGWRVRYVEAISNGDIAGIFAITQALRRARRRDAAARRTRPLAPAGQAHSGD